jgi:OOP family OmpA-OmpF porin
MNNKNSVRLILSAVLVFGGVQYAGAADDAGWYVGAGGGRSEVQRPGSFGQVETGILQQTRGISSTTQIDSHDTAWKIFGGYQFNENFAVEAAYHDLGSFKGVTTITAPAASVAPGKWDATAGSLAAVGMYPLVKGLFVMGKAGLAVSELKVSVPGALYSPSVNRVQPLLGVGLKYEFNKMFGLRAEFERFNNVGDGSDTGQSPIHVWSLGAQVRF